MTAQLRTVNSGDFSPFLISGVGVPWQDVMTAPFERYCNFGNAHIPSLLKREEIYTVLDLASCSEETLSSFRTLGEKGLNAIKGVLAQIGLRLPEAETSIYGIFATQLVAKGLNPLLVAELVASPGALQKIVEQADKLLQQRTGVSLLAGQVTPPSNGGQALRSAYSQEETPVIIQGMAYQWQAFLNLSIEALGQLTRTHHEHVRRLLLGDNIKTVRALVSCTPGYLRRLKGMKGNLAEQLIDSMESFGLRPAQEHEIELPMMIGVRRKVSLHVFLALRPSEIDLHPELDRFYGSVKKLLAANPKDVAELLGDEPAFWQNFLMQSIREEVTALTARTS